MIVVNTFLEVIHGFLDLICFQFADSHVKESQGISIINFECFFKVFNCRLMIAHVLEHQSPLNVDSLVVGELHLHLRKHGESFLVLSDFTVHQTQMEHARNEGRFEF